MKKVAVVLFNLGGPDSKTAIKPFLFNLFNDPAIIRAPLPIRWCLAKFISSRRAPVAAGIYDKIGGRSPIVANTRAQADALDAMLNKDAKTDGTFYKSFIVMRYWHPFAAGCVRAVKEFAPDEVLLLPLYPQFSTTTTASSFADWNRAAHKGDLSVPTRTICCYPEDADFIAAMASGVRAVYHRAATFGKPRVLFTAHGLPEKIVKAGDPYPQHCEKTAAALRSALSIDGLDSVLCYQSRVGPLKWIGPSTEEEVKRAGTDKVPLIVVPIAFVSDHSETLVEIDIEYRELAQRHGVPAFFFVPAVGTHPDFIAGLAKMVKGDPIPRACAPNIKACACQSQATV